MNIKAIHCSLVAALALKLAGIVIVHGCKISEHPCKGGAFCVPLDKYCDGKDDCGDGSDEPKMCTVCNRTYYGDIGRTYSLTVPPPQWNRLPFLCHLTFTASGNEQGDIVQIIFDRFTVGRFDEGLIDPDLDSSDASLTSGGDLPGCPEGFMQLSELGRPFTGGSWCGKASGHQLYFSETATVTASVKVFHAPMQTGTPFEFRIRYKFISQSDAIVRIDGPVTNLEKLSELFLESQRKTTHNEQSILHGIEQLKKAGSGPDSNLLLNLTKLLEMTNNLLDQQAIKPSPSSPPPTLEKIDTCRSTVHSGQYLLQLRDKSSPIPVVCLHKHQLTGDGWLVIQQRVDGSENFFRNWVDYRDGFGNLSREFWLGLENIHHITNAAPHELLVEMVTFDGSFYYARYSAFEIGNEQEKYILKKLGSYSGTAGDSLRVHVGMLFSTYDNDNDRADATDCAVTYIGAWWYDQCFAEYGAPNELLELGRVTPGTYCTRQYDECYRKKCRLQSPNYPGMYPRNVTCYWTIRQKVVPTCKHAMVAISQENEHKALVKRSIASLNKTSRAVRAWSDCTGERDHLIFYDGSSTNDPVLAKYCGGDWLPRVVSRGPEMLIAFHSSPFSAPLQSGQSNRGFELDVDILFADSDSHDFAQGHKCEFHINASSPDEVLYSRRGRMGHLLSPRHTLPPNTTCTYYFHGIPSDLVWISFTNYHLQILQQTGSGDNGTVIKSESAHPWITRLRIWDSVGTYVPIKTTSPSSIITTASSSSSSASQTAQASNAATGVTQPVFAGTSTTALYQQLMNRTVGTYYGTINQHGKNLKINVDNVWNPVDQYIYGPTVNSIFNQPHPQPQPHPVSGGMGSEKGLVFGGSIGLQEKMPKYSSGGSGKGKDGSRHGKDNEVVKESSSSGRREKSSRSNERRRMVAEFYDNDSPKLCDHVSLETNALRMRPCTPLESYVSTGSDLKIEFHTMTGTSLFPSSFGIKYEFVDTELGGEPYLGQKGEDVPLLCSRVFRKRKGEFQSPRNVFLHGRGGAKNISCLYRFEASVGERVRIELYNVSFGESATCTTESDGHTGRAKCTPSEADPDGRVGELRLFDVPYKDVKIPLGCFCDNTTSSYNSPLTFISNSRTMELTFTVTRLNISEDFAEVYFHAAYDFIKVPECKKRLKLRGSGGEDEVNYPLKSHEASCDGLPWYIEAQQQDRSLFVRTWGGFLSLDPTQDEFSKCNTRNRLLVYSGKPLKVVRVICPSSSSSRASALHIFSEDWLSSQPFLSLDSSSRPVSMVLEPIHKEPGSIAFSWLEIQRTKASLIQQLDLQTNFTANDTLVEFGLYPRETECEHRCPELDACIGKVLWCDGRPNCPSGYDESEQECGSRLMELPGGIFAAFGCLAAALSACLIFCVLAMVKKRRKSNEKLKTAPASLNGTLSKKDYKKEPLFFDPDS